MAPSRQSVAAIALCLFVQRSAAIGVSHTLAAQESTGRPGSHAAHHAAATPADAPALPRGVVRPADLVAVRVGIHEAAPASPVENDAAPEATVAEMAEKATEKTPTEAGADGASQPLAAAARAAALHQRPAPGTVPQATAQASNSLVPDGPGAVATAQASNSLVPDGLGAVVAGHDDLPKTATVEKDISPAGLSTQSSVVKADPQAKAGEAPVEVHWSGSLWAELWREAQDRMPSQNQVVKVLCMMSTTMVQLSPLPQARIWMARACTGEADGAPMVAIMYGGWQWLYYGFFAWLLTQRSGFLTLVYSNLLGAVLGSWYSYVYFRNCRHQKKIQMMQNYLVIIGFLVVTQVGALVVAPWDRALFFSGFIASCCSLIASCSTLVTIPEVARTRDSSSIPGPLVVAGLVNAALWTLCGKMLGDMWILIPSAFSILTNCTAFSIKVYFLEKDSSLLPLNSAKGYEQAPAVLSETQGKVLEVKGFEGADNTSKEYRIRDFFRTESKSASAPSPMATTGGTF